MAADDQVESSAVSRPPPAKTSQHSGQPTSERRRHYNDEEGQQQQPASHEKKKEFNGHGVGSKLGTLPLAILVFYNVSGGPFGVEETIQSAGAFFTLAGFLIAPFVWSIQEAYMTAELGSAFPEASGGVAWVEEAFGSSTAWVTGWLGYVAGTTDNAIYPAMFLEYCLEIMGTRKMMDMYPFGRFFAMACTCTVLAYVNWLGLKAIGRLSILICLIAMSPFLILSIAGIPSIDPRRWLELPDPDTALVVAYTDADIAGGFFPNATLFGILVRPYLNSLFWKTNSFNSAGSFAADVENPGKDLPRALCLAFVFIYFGYLIPLAVTLGASDAQQTDWVSGYMARAASDIVGPWLGNWMVLAAGISNFALFQGRMSAESFQLMGMAERAYVPKVFAMRSRFGTPTAAIILSTVFMVCMSVTKLEMLIELLNFNYAFGLLIEYSAFLKLRISQPNLHRPFRVPLPTWACFVCMIPTFTAILTIMMLSKFSTMAFSIVVNLVGAVVYILCRPGMLEEVCDRCRRLFFCCTGHEAPTTHKRRPIKKYTTRSTIGSETSENDEEDDNDNDETNDNNNNNKEQQPKPQPPLDHDEDGVDKTGVLYSTGHSNMSLSNESLDSTNSNVESAGLGDADVDDSDDDELLVKYAVHT